MATRANPEAGTDPFAASAWYDADTGVASRLPADPTVTGETAAGYFFSAWTGRAVWALNYLGRAGPDDVATASAFDPDANAWQGIPAAPFACAGVTTPEWTGAAVLLYCPDAYPAPSQAVGGLEFVPGS